MRLVVLYSILAVILLLQPSSAETIEVCEKCDFSTIQDAINASKEGDTILVASGMYRENLRISKSIKIVGSDGTILEPKLTAFPTIEVVLAQNFSLENIQIDNSSTGLEIVLLNGFNIKDCSFNNNRQAVTVRESANGNFERLKIERFGTGVSIELSKFISLKYSLLEDGSLGIEVLDSEKSTLSDLVIRDAIKGIELLDGEQNSVENVMFSGDVFVSSLSERGFLISDSVAESRIFSSDRSFGSMYVFKGLNVSGDEFQISIAKITLPTGFVQLSDVINATIIPNVYTNGGSIHMEATLGDDEIENLSSYINLSTLAFYRLNKGKLERVSDRYNTSHLSFISNKSGVYLLGAEIIQSQKTPTPVPTVTKTPVAIEQSNQIPGFEIVTGLMCIIIALAFSLRRRSEK